MLHELLLALSGHPGSIFVKDSEENVHVVYNLPFIHPTEVALLNRLCRLATHYCKLQAFTAQYGQTPFLGKNTELHGLYIRAFCEGLNRVLDPYRYALLCLEKELLCDENLTAAHVQTALEEYQMLFPALVSVMEQIKQHKAHGCHILEVLHQASASGMSSVHRAFNQMLHLCHGILYKQLASWMLQGMLQDSYSEFFIQRRLASPQQQGPASPEEDDLGLGSISSKQIKDIVALTEEGRSENVHFQFCLNAEMLPSYIPIRVAQKILFVGESVAMFERNRKGRHKHAESILKEKSDDFAKELLELSHQPEFCLMAFEACMDRIRTYVAEQLWVLVVEKSDLLGELRCMKEFFLLGRGELFLAFIDRAQNLLAAPPTARTQHDINITFQQAARNVLLEDESLLQKFSLETPAQESKDAAQSKGTDPSLSAKDAGESVESRRGGVESGWNVLSLRCQVDWPLHILYTPGVLERYNRLFQFLLFVRRSQLALQQCWALQMQGCHTAGAHAFSSKWWLRTHMAFLVDNLQYYLQVDVIDSQFSILQEKIEKTRDFEAIRFAHEHFLTALLSQSFLLTKPIARCLKELLELCHKFCGLLSRSEETLTEKETEQMENISKDFQRQTGLLFQLLSSVRSHQASPHLAQFLLRVDYNKYFSSSKGQLRNQEASVNEPTARSSRRY